VFLFTHLKESRLLKSPPFGITVLSNYVHFLCLLTPSFALDFFTLTQDIIKLCSNIRSYHFIRTYKNVMETSCRHLQIKTYLTIQIIKGNAEWSWLKKWRENSDLFWKETFSCPSFDVNRLEKGHWTGEVLADKWVPVFPVFNRPLVLWKKYFVFMKRTYSSRYSFVACNSRYA
jgi:hypothetical protein